MKKQCWKCGSSDVRMFIAEIVFARSLAEPVAVPGTLPALVCMRCGLCEISIPQDPLSHLQDDIFPELPEIFMHGCHEW